MGCASTKTQPGCNAEIRDIYRINKILGSGSFGQVRECTHIRTRKQFAVKIVERKCDTSGAWSNESMFRREIALLENLKHPNIIQYKERFEDNVFFYAIIERCYGGELFEQIVKRRSFLEKDAAVLVKQMLEALVYLHARNIVHRDVKAENFLFKTTDIESPIVLIDFGMATQLKDGNLDEVCGSPHYLAPELIGQKYGMKADIWALGVLTYLMLFGKYPFDGKSTSEIVNSILNKNIESKIKRSHISSMGRKFIGMLLTRSPEDRPTAADALQHMWLFNDKDMKTKIPMEVVRTAHRKVTCTKKKVDPQVDERRTKLLEKLEDEFKQGIRRNIRLKQVNKLKPEFSRIHKRNLTTPSILNTSRRTTASSAEGDAQQRELSDEQVDEIYKEEIKRRKIEKRSFTMSEVYNQKRAKIKMKVDGYSPQKKTYLPQARK